MISIKEIHQTIKSMLNKELNLRLHERKIISLEIETKPIILIYQKIQK